MQKRLVRWIPALALLLTAGAASAQPCCECRCPGNEPRACSEEFGTDNDAYQEAVCEPLGCSIAVCADRSCRQSNRCPREETDFCADGFDNDADGDFDCDDPDCDDAEGCDGEPTPGETPGASPSATPDGPVTPTEEPTTPGGPTATDTPETPVPTVTPGPVDRDCCVGRGEGTGCDVPNCERCVCREDSFCCDTIWDATCADLAATECDGVCRCEDVTPTVTPTATRTGSPQVANDCCIGRPEEDGPGCSVTPCERCVCEVDGFCCEDFWDPACAEIASEDCPDECTCDAITPGPTEPPETPPTVAGSRTPTRAVFPTQTRRPCTTDGDCERGQTCNSAGRCIGSLPTPPDGGGGGGGGGSCTVGAPIGEPSWLALIVPAVLWAARRRQVRGGSR